MTCSRQLGVRCKNIPSWQDPARYEWYVNGVGTDNTLTSEAGGVLRFQATTTHSRAVASVGSAADVLAMGEPTIVCQVSNTLDLGDFCSFGFWGIQDQGLVIEDPPLEHWVTFMGYRAPNVGRGWSRKAFNLASSSGWQTVHYAALTSDTWMGIKMLTNKSGELHTSPDGNNWTFRKAFDGSTDFERVGFGIGGLGAVTGTEDRADVINVAVGTVPI